MAASIALSSSKSVAKRNSLTLKMKYEVVLSVEKDSKLSIRKLAEMFNCGKTQISTILKNKAQIKDLYESNANETACLAQKKAWTSEYSDVNDKLLEWYQMAVQRNLFPDGTLLAEKAKVLAECLGHKDFKASNGLLHRWKTRNNIKQKTICGESGDVRLDTVESWKERLPEILAVYGAEDIWNLDETACFWKTLPDKGLCKIKKQCKGGKKASTELPLHLL